MKYPRTYHLPWSEAITSDDKRLAEYELETLQNSPVVYTEKLDGENTNFGKNFIHARSSDKKYRRPWQTWMRGWWEGISYTLPENLQFCGECMYAKHSIEYSHLSSYFYLFSVFDLENQMVLSWEDVEYWASKLSILTVPRLISPFGLVPHSIMLKESWYGEEAEGYVVRNADSFPLSDFKYNVAKFVRKNHVQTDVHWTKEWKKNNIVQGQ